MANQSVPGAPASPGMAQLLPSLIGTGAQLGGTILGMHQQGKTLEEQKREFDLNQQRKNQMLRLALPGMLANLGYNSNQVPGMMSNPSMTPQFTPPASSGGGGHSGLLGGILGGAAGLASTILPGLLHKSQGVPYTPEVMP